MSERSRPLSPGQAGRIDPICDEVESLWIAGYEPRLEDFLLRVDEVDRVALFSELLAIELEYRSRLGKLPDESSFCERHPNYSAIIGEVFQDTRIRLATDELADSQVGPYRILTRIDSGGMGVVWLAHDPLMNRTLAIKVLQVRHRQRPDLLRRFHAEARLTAQLQHPAIPPVYQMGTLEDGRPYFAMKWVRGQTLSQLLSNRASPNEQWPKMLSVFEQVCQAVAYAHSCGVIHRDLKPSNVMVGAFGEVQLMDWGLAKQRGGTDTVAEYLGTEKASQSQAGALLGTPAYMAPEQARGEVEQVDERADVFGLGGILCAILTGNPPFDGTSSHEVCRKAAAGELQAARAALEVCGGDTELIELAKRCLESQADQRFPNGAEVAHTMARYLQGVQERLKQAEIEQAQTRLRAAEQAKRRRLWWTATGVVLTVLLLGITGTTWGLFRAENARVEEQKQRTQAENARNQARENYQLALKAFNNIVFSIDSKLNKQSGTLHLRKELLTTAREGLQKLLQASERQEEPDHTLVAAHYSAADVELLLGNVAVARREYERGIERSRQFAEREPLNAQAQRDIIVGYEKTITILERLGERTKALEQSHELTAKAARIAKENPTNGQFQRDLSVCHNRNARLLILAGQIDEAIRELEKAKKIDEELLAKDEFDDLCRTDRATTLNQLGEAMLRTNKATEAIDYLQQSVKQFEQLVTGNRDNINHQRSLSVALNSLGDAKAKIGKLQDSHICYDKALKINRELVEANPQNIKFLRDLSMTYDKLGDNKLKQKQTPEALADFRESKMIREKIVKIDPADTQAQRDLMLSNNILGDVMLIQNNPDEALRFYRPMLESAERLVILDSDNPLTIRDLSISVVKIGDVLITQGKPDEALDYYCRVMEMNWRMYTMAPKDIQNRSDLAFSYYKIGDVTLELGQTEHSIHFYRQALSILQQIASEDARNAESQMNLFRLYWKLAQAEMRSHNYKVALNTYLEAKKVLSTLQAKQLLTAQATRYLAMVENKIRFCRAAEPSIARLAVALAQPQELVGNLLLLRVAVLVERNHVGEAIKTAECYRDWANKIWWGRDPQLYDVARAFATCAAADAQRRKVLIKQAMVCLRTIRDSGYFKDKSKLAELERDVIFSEMREEVVFAAFVQSLKK